MKIRMILRAAAISATLMLGIAPASVASASDEGTGIEAIVLERNLARRTLLLDNGVTLQVTAKTTIENPNGEAVRFEELPIPDRYRGGYAVTGASRITYETTGEGGGAREAQHIVLVGVDMQ